MGELHIHNSVCKLISKQKIMPHDMIMLKDELASESDPSILVANLIALETAVQNKCPQWDQYFISTICDFLLSGSEPEGQISDHQLAWIMNALARNGITHKRNEFEVIICLIERATSVPVKLCTLALDEICRMYYEQKRHIGDHNSYIQKIASDDPYCDLRRSINRMLPALSRTCVHQELRAKSMLEMMVQQPKARNSSAAFGFLKEKLAHL